MTGPGAPHLPADPPPTWALTPLGHLHSDYPEKFGIPRQSGLVEAARAQLTLDPELGPHSLEGLNGFSHLWLIFGFHAVSPDAVRTRVRPPRLGGNTSVGVFATRSPFRPNRLGLSLVELEKITVEKDQPTLFLRGVDLLDGTPIFDIKPYLPQREARPEAHSGFAPQDPTPLPVRLTPEAHQQLPSWPPRHQALLLQTLALDPRPAYHQDPQRRYRTTFPPGEAEWSCDSTEITVHRLHPGLAP